MSYKTIRKNALKTIKATLEQCSVIHCHEYDEMKSYADNKTFSVTDVLEAGKKFEFDRVYLSLEGEEWTYIRCVIHSNYFFTGYRSKEAARRLMTKEAFAKSFPDDAAAELVLDELKQKQLAEQRSNDQAKAVINQKTNVSQPIFYLGQHIIAKFSTKIKFSHIADYINECSKPQENPPYWIDNQWKKNFNWEIRECKIQKILTLEPLEYDLFMVNLLEDRYYFFNGTGGTSSDFNLNREIKNFGELTDEEQVKWRALAYSLVVIIQSHGRKSIAVNPEGHNYVRYVGIEPTQIYVDKSIKIVSNQH
ncbi:hypothetical protein [Iodobacter fluviatilis]|uniref:Uncharacterized protein n=1 Tax=Iodobacter fluviatilis TaxID=537 RepID=A0A377Q4A7_9NEIS|nr:hypothetical protein [Iodobacter fluviatilis]TCU84589.1 hypothetical protein EV682_109114 [Iodobacter fluviatilis]STQ90054.1 Uncharacterised protein [Iodobacter fluviatilis]